VWEARPDLRDRGLQYPDLKLQTWPQQRYETRWRSISVAGWPKHRTRKSLGTMYPRPSYLSRGLEFRMITEEPLRLRWFSQEITVGRSGTMAVRVSTAASQLNAILKAYSNAIGLGTTEYLIALLRRSRCSIISVNQTITTFTTRPRARQHEPPS
jgi:hypothetical protein